MIVITDLKKKIGDRLITKGVSLTIPQGKMTVVLGRSGEGKSLLLKQIIGLIKPTSGTIVIDGIDINKQQLIHKKVGYVFQFAALLDSLNVFENIGITLLEQGIDREEVMRIVKQKLALVHLKQDTLAKYPSELSGGMRKRVGLARTLVTNPDIILYDEPTTGLDPITSRVIHELMLSTQQQLGLTSVVISHDIEILKFADYVALLHEGVIAYYGDAKTAFNSDNHYISQFLQGNTQGPIQSDPQE